LRTNDGLTTVTFNVAAGRIKLFLPDDITSGDTISGTVITEPAGSDEAEKAKNATVLKTLTVFLDQTAITPDSGPKFSWTPRPPTPNRYIIRLSEILPSQNAPAVYAQLYPVGTPSPPVFTIPVTGQSGRVTVIPGPFDGNSDNTKCTIADTPCRIIAESPRKLVVRVPIEPVGPTTISIGDGKSPTVSGTFRNLGVNLSAPKTSLMKGEKTTVSVQVLGLAGITGPVNVQLVTIGAVNMDGGNTQTLNISPGQVGSDGKASVTKGIIAVQPGSFSVTATVLQ
jgi:hypothetical protein